MDAAIIIQFISADKVSNIILSPLIDKCKILIYCMTKSFKHVFREKKNTDALSRLRSNFQLSSSPNDVRLHLAI